VRLGVQFRRPKAASPPQELEVLGAERPKLLVYQYRSRDSQEIWVNVTPVSILLQNLPRVVEGAGAE
jgi:hypothetical protein